MDLRKPVSSQSRPTDSDSTSSPSSGAGAPSASRRSGKGNASTVAIAAGAGAGLTIGGFFLELFKIILLSLMIIVPVRYFLVQPFFVKGDSMEPNFSNGQYLLIDELSYRFGAPERGDVIVFHAPHTAGTFYIKRVIGLPGDTVEVKDGEVIVKNDAFPRGVELEELYLPAALKTPGSTVTQLGSDEYYVLGDNRGQSSDSRVFGPIRESHIVGRAWVRGWPVANAGSIDAPDYPFIGN